MDLGRTVNEGFLPLGRETLRKRDGSIFLFIGVKIIVKDAL